MCGLHKNTWAASTATCRMAGAHGEGTSFLRRYWVRLAPLRRYFSDHPFRMANTGQELLDLFEARARSGDTNTTRVRSATTDSLPEPGDEIRSRTKAGVGIFN
jgi:hypothetical protein